MARLHTQTSNWNNPNTAIPNEPRAYFPVDQRPVNSVNIPQEINVVTKIVSDYDPNNVTMAKTIVQPIAIVPFNTTEQPLYQYLPQNTYGNAGSQDGYQGYENENYDAHLDNVGAKKGVNGIKIVLLLLSLLYIALVVVGKFVDIAYLKFYGTQNGLEILLTVTTAFKPGLAIKEMLLPILLAANCLFVVLIFLTSIIGIKKGVSIFVKIISILSLLSIGGFGYLIFDAKLGFGYGLYAAAGLTVLMALLALIGKRRR
jgi:hypothetical protein